MERHRCYGCMELTDQAVCPRCGWAHDRDNAAHQLKAGSVLKEQYLVGRVLGQGGFGITYLGWDTVLEAPVAVKEFYPRELVTRDHNESDSVAVYSAEMGPAFIAGRDRIVREAKALAKLRDIPQIVGVQNCFHANGTVYIVMEYVRGMELVRFVNQKGRLSMEQTLDILDPVISALEKVHKQGLVHRDISPDNIMLDMMGNARVLDFGAVRSLEAGEADGEMAHSTEAIVKHGFAPTEQYRSRGVLGPWTDEYALCATIWYCLTGFPPPDALALSMEEETLDRSAVPGLTDAQWAALSKGLSPRAKDRFGDLALLREALRGGGAQTVQEPPKKKKKGWLAALIVLLVLGAAGAGAWSSGLWKQIPGLEKILSGSAGQMSAQATEPSTAPTTEATEPSTAPTTEATTAPTAEPTTEPTTEPTAEPTAEPTRPPEPWEANVLVKDPFKVMDFTRESVTSVEFRSKTSGSAGKKTYDISQAKDGSVLGWIESGTLVIAAEGGINGAEACAGLFRNCIYLKEVSFGGAFHTEQVTDMSEMFRRCPNLVTVDTENLDTSNVVTMAHMFDMHNMDGSTAVFTTNGNHVLKALDMSTWDVSNVRDMSYMFYYCNLLKTVFCEDWDTSSVTDMSWMFAYCTEMKEVTVDQWDTGAVEDMSYMFYGCAYMEDLDLQDWDTSSVATMTHMFDGCVAIRILDLENWNTGKVTDMTYMFNNCRNLEAPNVTGWDVSSLRDASYMFYKGIRTGSFDVSGWDTSDLRNVAHMFDAYSKEIKISGVSNWDRKYLAGYEARYTEFATWGLYIDGKDWHDWFNA